MKRILIVFILLLFSFALCFAGGQGEDEIESEGLSGELLIAVHGTTDLKFDTFTQICEDFMELNPNTDIEFVSYGKDYESLMKGKMAANDLPDVFSTHGWGVKRYAEYLRPLNDLDLAENLSPAIENSVTTAVLRCQSLNTQNAHYFK